jgi:Tat protein secretion system quality control protein TatD with DNase activity
MDTLEKMISENRDVVVAIGECGLDYHYLSDRKDEEIAIQRYSFARQAEW